MQSTRGDIGIYIALTTAMVMLGSAVLLSLLLARQISLTQDLVASERAFFAANAGEEEAFYRLARERQRPPTDPLNFSVPDINADFVYPGAQKASYTATQLRFLNNVAQGCILGIYPAPNGEVRRLVIGPLTC